MAIAGSTAMEAQNLSILNPTPQRIEGPQLLHDLVASSSNDPALEHLSAENVSSYTYAELHAASNTIAHKLSQLRPDGTRPFIVPVLLQQSPCLYGSLLGILKAGGAFCPLNTDAPRERLKFILQDVSATVVVVSSALKSMVESVENVHLIVIDTLELSASPETPISRPDLKPTDPAYIMYTSGSTGTPKGVVISHDAASQALLAHENRIPTFSRFFQFASPTFDVSVFEIFFPLSRGKTLISADRSATLDNLPAILSRMRVDACELTPTVAAGLLKRRDPVPTLQLLLTIGEMLNVTTVTEFGGRAEKPSILWAMYGPTEATIHCTLQQSFSSDSSTGIIGTPLQTVSCFILDLEEPFSSEGQVNICPQGSTGELAVGGHQLATEYLNRPEQTSKAFVDTRFGRLYRTGDKARLNADGSLECFGRLSDGQIKLRGQRIELGEIEHAMLGTVGCHLAAALVVDSCIIGFCTAESSVTENDVLNICQDWLPQYMVPTEVVILPDLPRLPSGKVDKPSLKTLFERRAHDVERTVTRPDTEDEEHHSLLQILSDHLNSPVSSRQTLASLGVDSLKAIRLASVLRANGFHIDVATIMKARTVADISRKLTQFENSASSDSSVNFSLLNKLDAILLQNPSLQLIRNEIEDVQPCTELQTAMLTASPTEHRLYCNEIEFEIDNSVPLQSLKRGLENLCARTEILRTGFLEWNDHPVAVVFRTPRTKCIETKAQDRDSNEENDISWMRPFMASLLPASEPHPSRMLIRIHHAIYDGWSMDLLLHDLGMLVRGQHPPRRPPFKGLVERLQRDEDNEAATHKSFWADQFSGWSRRPFPVLIEQPSTRSDIESVTHELAIPRKQVTEAIDRTGCGLPSVFLAALGMIWRGIIGSDDIVLGTVTSGRTIPLIDVDEIIGPMMAALPLRIQFQNIKTVDQLLRYVEDSSTDLLEHSSLSPAEIRKQARLQPWESVYEVLFAFQESLLSREVRNGLFKTRRHIDRLETKLLIEAEPSEDGFSLQATYHASALDSSVATQILSQLASAFDNLISQGATPLQFPLEPHQVAMSEWDHLSEISSQEKSLSDHLEATLQNHGPLPAIELLTSPDTGHTDVLTYNELNSHANRVARWLQEQGALPGDVVGIMMEKSHLLYVAILGIMKAGCGYLPLLPRTPAARVSHIIGQSSSRICMLDDSPALSDGVKEMSSAVTVSMETFAGFSTDSLQIPFNKDRVAYVVYTSGTTGTPKGVSVSQENIVSNIQHLQTLYPVSDTKQARFLQACSQAFDVSVFEIFFAWLSGMCLCTGTNDTLFADLEDNIRSLQITHLSLTPTVAAMIDPKKVPSVEFLVTAGEPLTRSVLNSWDSILWQGYGPSETTNICTAKQMHREFNIEHLGKAFPNTSAFVLRTGGMQTLPIGWVGELCFGGQQVALGYMNAPDLTSEKFVEHEEYGRLYRSGDLGRMLPDGSLVILGRLDNQVKVRGQRVELAEIDAVLAMHKEVTSATTLLLDIPGCANPSLVSFYTSVEGTKTPGTEVLVPDPQTDRSVRSLLQARLPSYMIPSQLIYITHLPRTSNGKCNSQVLTKLLHELPADYHNKSLSPGTGEDDERDWTARELLIRTSIADTLGVLDTDIGRWTSLIGVGLDSISAVKVSRSLTQALGTRVSISAILSNPCVSLLERHITTKRDGDTIQHPLVSTEVQNHVLGQFDDEFGDSLRVLPCTPLQEAMLTQVRDVYYNKTLLRLRTSPAKMRTLWTEIASRHEIFRTCFITTRDQSTPIVQVVLDKWDVPWQVYESTDLSMVDVVERHLRTLPEPLDSKSPPISLAIIHYRDSYFLSLICHHALYDGTAMNVLWREVESMAHGHQLPAPVPYEPFLHQMRHEAPDWSRFWTSYLRDSQHLHVFSPVRGESMANQASYSADFELSLSDVQAQLRTMKVGLLSLCQAAWAVVLSTLTGSSDVVFGNVVSGRNVDLPEVERLVAPCFNTIPIRRVLQDTMSSSQLLRSFHNDNQMLLPYQFSPVRKIAKLMGLRSIFDTLLLVQQPLEEMDDSVWNLEEDSGNMGMPMVCEITPCPNLNTITVKMYYDMAIIAPDEAIAITTDLTKVAAELVRSPLSPIRLDPDIATTKRKNAVKPTTYSRQPLLDDIDVEEDANWLPLELTIREILANLTSSPESTIKKSTSIFRLGLDSISAVQIAERLRSLGYTLSTSVVLQNPTCEALSHAISTTLVDCDQRPLQYDFRAFRDSIKRDIHEFFPEQSQIEDILPCTPLQCAMATASEIGDGGYINLIGFELEEHLSLSQLRMAWDAVRRHHHMLRTALIPVKSLESPYAMVRLSAASLQLPFETSKAAGDAESKSDQLKSEVGSDFLRVRHIPSWKVVVTEGEQRRHMYLIIHHSLYDAKSLRVMLTDLAAALAGHTIESTPDPREGLSDILTVDIAHRAKSSEFWQSYAERLVVNRFPILTPLREDEGQQLSVSITSRQSFSSIQHRASVLSVTVQTVIEAAWTRLLAAYTGEDEVTFGVTLSTRSTRATELTPIPCLTTLPVIARNTTSNKSLLNSLAEYDAMTSVHRGCSMSDVQKWLGHPASAVFDTLITYQGPAWSSDVKPPWRIIEEVGVVEIPLALELEPTSSDELRLTLTYTTKRIPSKHADYILRQFDTIMNSLLVDHEDGNPRLYERQPELFSVVAAEEKVIPTEIRCLHEFVERQAIRTPDAPALEYAATLESTRRVWSYRELNDMGDRVAETLRRLQVRGSIVAVHFDKCPEAYFAILGILKAGFAFVALDPAMPSARKSFIMQDSQACCLLMRSHEAPDFDTHVPVQGIDEGVLRSMIGVSPEVSKSIDPSSTCYCLYTSGTTGQPKGCEITHENTVQAMLAFQHLFRGRWTAKSRWLQFAALHFDVSILEQYWSWSVGITMVVAPREVILDDLAGSISTLGITHLDLTPSLARLLRPDDVPSLWEGVFITGGEQLKQEILDAWGPKGVIHNSYGPTEATIGVTTYSQVPRNGRPSNIGQQFRNVGTYVLEPNTDTPVLYGAVGELCIAGKLVGKGYINRAEATAKAFPWLSRFNERVYRTGDLVRLLSDSSFEFLGRADDQVKLRGQRLELGEIDHVIRGAVPDVQDVATIVVTQKSPDRSVLVCFLGTGKSSGQELRPSSDNGGFGHRARAACRSKLPPYMVPTYFLVVPFIPLSINNKAEHKILRQAFEKLSSTDLLSLTSSAVPRQDQNSQGVSDFIKLAFTNFNDSDISRLPPSTSLFELGVDSVNVAMFAACVRKAGVSCTPAVVLQHPTLSDLSEALIADNVTVDDASVGDARRAIQAALHMHSQTAQKVLNAGQDAIEYIAPCTPLQEGMVTIALTSNPRGAYFASFELRLSDAVDLLLLRDSWTRLIGRYAILRTSFIQTSQGCIQVALRQADVDWTEATDEAQRLVRKQTWMSEDDRSIKKPIQFTHLNDGVNSRLCVDIFHGVYDGTSLQNMLHELRELYKGRAVNDAPSFVEAITHGPLQQFHACKDFWSAHLKGWDSGGMPSRQVNMESEGKPLSSRKILPCESFRAALQHHGITSQSLLLGLWTSALSQICAQDPSLGVVIGGRSLDLAGIEQTIGPLFNTVPFFAGSCHGSTWRDLFRHCQSFTSAILDFQHVPLRDVQKWCNSGTPLFNTLFTVQVEGTVDSANEALWEVVESTTIADYPLAFEAILQEDGNVSLQAVASQTIVTQQRLDELLAQVEQYLGEVIADADASWRKDSALANLVAPSASKQDRQKPKASQDFKWTTQAEAIRRTLATMSQTSADVIGADTAILELGLDSIDMLRLSSQLRDMDIQIAPSVIMRCKTLADMVNAVSDHDYSSTEQTLKRDSHVLLDKLRSSITTTTADVSTVESVLPTTPLQEGMVMAMLQSEFRQYFNHEVLRLRPDIDLERLREAWNSVIRANSILRTGFAEVVDESLDMSYCQVIHTYQSQQFEHHDLDQQSDFDRLFRLARSLAMETSGLGNMVQVRFASLNSSRYMIISIAHALYDGWSLGLLYHDLQLALDYQLRPRASPADYASQYITRRNDESHQFWKEFLTGARPTILFSDSPNSEEGAGYRTEAVSPLTAGQALGFCKTRGVSFQALCYACWAVILAQRTRQLDVSFGVVLSGRDFEGAEELMFPTMNTVAQRCILSGTCLSFLTYLDENLRHMRPWQAYPLSKAMRASSGDRMLFDTLLMVQKSPETSEESQSAFEPIIGDSKTDFGLSVEAELVDDRLVWRATSQHPSYGDQGLARLVEDLNCALRFLVAQPNHKLVDVVDNKATICGLPQVRLRPESLVNGADSEPSTDGEGEPEQTFPATAIIEVLSVVSQVPVSDIRTWNSIYHLGLDSISAIKVSTLLMQKGVTLRPRDLLMATDISDMASKASSRSLELAREEKEFATAEAALWTPPADVDVAQILAQYGIPSSNVEKVLPALPAQVYMILSWHMTQGQIFFPEFRLKLPMGVPASSVRGAWLKMREAMPLLRTSFCLTGSKDMPIMQVIRKSSAGFSDGNWISCSTEADNQGGTALLLKIHHALYDAFSLPTLARMLLDSCSNPSADLRPSQLQPWVNHAIQPTIQDHQQAKREYWQKYFNDSTNYQHVTPPISVDSCVDRTSYIASDAVRDTTSLREAAARLGTTVQALFLAAYAKTLAADRQDQQRPSRVILGIYFANRGAAEVLPEEYPTLCIIPIKVKVDSSSSLGPAALAVQRDLNEVSSKGMAEVGLWQIKNWTGVTVDTVINFVASDTETTTGQGQLEWLPPRDHDAQEHEGLVQPSAFNDGGGWMHTLLADAYPVSFEP